MENNKQHYSEKELIFRLLINLIVTAFGALLVALLMQGRPWVYDNTNDLFEHISFWKLKNVAMLLFVLFFFIGMHFILPVKKMYSWIFEKRWLMGCLLLLFLTVNRYHGDSIGYYNDVIQPGLGSEASNPLLGYTRGIRSDEFIVNTPSVLASGYGEDPYGKNNKIMRGADTLNIVNGVYLGYATIGNAPWELIYSILPTEYAFSFCWYAPMILGFLMSIELFYIISGKKPLLSVMGAFLIIFSSFYQWWTFSTYFISAPGTVVCLYYFLNDEKRWKKVLYGLGIAVCFSMFVTNLYPAWQVPLGYMFLVIGIWLIYDNWDKIKSLKKKDWAILSGCILFMVSLICSYFYNTLDYISAINSTVYPGERFDAGSFQLQKLFYYAQSPFYAYQDIGNPCEAGVFYSFFPIPTLVASYCWIKDKKKDILTGGLLLIMLPMLLYVTVGLPDIVANITLFSHSQAIRMADIIGLIQIYFIVIVMSRFEETKKLPISLAVFGSGVTALVSILISDNYYAGYMSTIQKLGMFIVIACCCTGLLINLSKKMKNIWMLSLIMISIFTGIYVRPLMQGLDAIYSKPVAREIKSINSTDENAKWLTYGLGIVLSGYSVSCGSSTLNSVNTYPNMDLWSELDPSGQYEEIYNRYAHISVSFTDDDTSFEMISADWIKLNLSYKDMKKTNVTYILAGEELMVNEDNGFVKFEKMYDETGIQIYHLVYK